MLCKKKQKVKLYTQAGEYFICLFISLAYIFYLSSSFISSFLHTFLLSFRSSFFFPSIHPAIHPDIHPSIHLLTMAHIKDGCQRK